MNMPASQPDACTLCRLLDGHRFALHDEKALQDGIELVLSAHQVPYEREAVLDAQSRPDFLVGTLVIEVKIKGSAAQFLRQAHRYLEHDHVHAVIAVGTPHWISLLPPDLAGKPLHSLRLLGSLL